MIFKLKIKYFILDAFEMVLHSIIFNIINKHFKIDLALSAFKHFHRKAYGLYIKTKTPL